MESVVSINTESYLNVFLVGIFDIDLNAEDSTPTAINPTRDLPPEEIEEYEAFARPRVRRSQPLNDHHTDRPGFVGSLPADAYLQKLAIGPTAASFAGQRTDWKQVTRQRLAEDEARAAAELEEAEARKADEDSPADECGLHTVDDLFRHLTGKTDCVNILIVADLPAILPRRRSASTTSIASSLPIEIHVRRARTTDNTSFTFAPKTSLVDRPGIKVPPLPLRISTPSGANEVRPLIAINQSSSGPPTPGGGNRSRSKSVSSLARDRTYAARDVSQMRDPGEALGVPEEEDEDEYVAGENGLEEDDPGRLNAYKILTRQTDALG